MPPATSDKRVGRMGELIPSLSTIQPTRPSRGGDLTTFCSALQGTAHSRYASHRSQLTSSIRLLPLDSESFVACYSPREDSSNTTSECEFEEEPLDDEQPSSVENETDDKMVPSNVPKTACDSRAKFDRSLIRHLMKTIGRHKAIKMLQFACAIYVVFCTYGPDGSFDHQSGQIVDKASAERTMKGLILDSGSERAIVAATGFQVFAVSVARISAWFMYPGKAKNAQLWLVLAKHS